MGRAKYLTLAEANEKLRANGGRPIFANVVALIVTLTTTQKSKGSGEWG